jgi:hypothetical protein
LIEEIIVLGFDAGVKTTNDDASEGNHIGLKNHNRNQTHEPQKKPKVPTSPKRKKPKRYRIFILNAYSK